MQKFLVLYSMPHAGLEEWQKKPEAERKAQESELQGEWQTWMSTHGSMLTGVTAGVGKPKRITSSGTTDEHNDLMLCSMAEGESHETIAKAFEGHPHLKIPGAWIEIMPLNPLPGMEGM